MTSSVEFFEQLVLEFPELQKELESDFGRGLNHVQMGAFARVTQQAIEKGNFEHVCRYTTFVDLSFPNADPELENALYVSYLENIYFDGKNGVEAWNHLPNSFQKIYTDFMKALEQSALKLSKKPVKVKARKQSRGSKKKSR
jgi:hypothetical protein